MQLQLGVDESYTLMVTKSNGRSIVPGISVEVVLEFSFFPLCVSLSDLIGLILQLATPLKLISDESEAPIFLDNT